MNGGLFLLATLPMRQRFRDASDRHTASLRGTGVWQPELVQRLPQDGACFPERSRTAATAWRVGMGNVAIQIDPGRYAADIGDGLLIGFLLDRFHVMHQRFLSTHAATFRI
ncbi:MAG: hypothetical protein WCC08_02535 [Terrimicrobiaceae bacterium]